MNESETTKPQTSAIADALVYATAYIAIAPGDNDREDDDCRALETIAHLLSRCTGEEREMLGAAARRAMATEGGDSVESPLTNAYRDFLDTLEALFPNRTGA